MLKMRLSMGGTKKRPVYKIVVADSRFPRDGRFIEKLGFFNPLLPKDKKERVGLDLERIKYWLGQGARPTTRVARILGENEIMPMPAKGNNPQKAIPKKDRKKEGETGEAKAEARAKLFVRGMLDNWYISTFLDQDEAQIVEENLQAFAQAYAQNSDIIEGVPDAIVEKLVNNLTFTGDNDDIERIIDELKQFKKAGLDEIAIRLYKDPKESMELIAERVMPYLQ